MAKPMVLVAPWVFMSKQTFKDYEKRLGKFKNDVQQMFIIYNYKTRKIVLL